MSIAVESKHICTNRYVVVSGRITSMRYNKVFEQLTIELDVTGSRFEFYSRKPFIIRRIIGWYDGLVPGKRVTIDVIRTLEIIGCR